MRFRFWKYFGPIGVTGTISKIPAILILIVYYSLALLGILSVAALIYALV